MPHKNLSYEELSNTCAGAQNDLLKNMWAVQALCNNEVQWSKWIRVFPKSEERYRFGLFKHHIRDPHILISSRYPGQRDSTDVFPLHEIRSRLTVMVSGENKSVFEAAENFWRQAQPSERAS